MSQTIGVIGVGSIGSVLAQGFDEVGHDVVGHDVDPGKVSRLDIPKRSPSWIARNADVAVIAVPTPTTPEGGDASAVAGVLEKLGEPEATVCIRSTMPPGETGRLAQEFDIPLVYSPEFLRDRSDVSDFFDSDRIVLAGPESQRCDVLRALDTPEIDCDTVIETNDYLTAEIAKEAHNAFFATKVSFANQLRLIAEAVGADPRTIMDIVVADSRNTSSHLDPMLGPYGGKCLPKDTRALTLFAEEHRTPTPLLRGVMDLNDTAEAEFDNVEIEGNWPNVSAKGD